MPERRRLEVWCFGEQAGILTEQGVGLNFSYAEAWRTASRPPLSQSLPLSGEFDDEAASAFFGGLLPEGSPRDVLARQLGISRDNDFSLLEALGGDTAGAISLTALGEGLPPDASGADVKWLDDEELAREIHELPIRPMHADDEGEYRLSLAGAQDKLPVVLGRDGRVGLTQGASPSTHIMKTPISLLEHTVANEALCMDIGRRLGIPTAAAAPRRVGDTECLLVERYDREEHAGGVVERLHQEDFCQALGIPTARKYQAEGGPSLPDCFALIRRASSVPARDAVRLLDYALLSFLVGNHDAHGKNYSLVYGPDGTDLAPAYDVLCTFVYRGARRMSRKMAMSIGSEYRPEYVRARHFQEMLGEAQLGGAVARRRVVDLAGRAPGAAREALEALEAEGWGAPVLARIVEMVEARARALHQIVTEAAPAGTSVTPLTPEQRMVELRRRMAEGPTALRRSLDAAKRIVDALGQPAPGTAAMIDTAVEEVVAEVRRFSGMVWATLGDVDEGRLAIADLEELGPLLRGQARSSMELLEGLRTVSIAEPGARMAMERLVRAEATIAEWDARLGTLGVPEPPVDG